MASRRGLNEDFNISAREELTVAEIARICWEACGNDPDELELEHLPSSEVDVQRRWPSVEKARAAARAGRRRSACARASRRRSEWLREQRRRWPPCERAKRALITGITGQDGSYLAELLLDKGYEVHGMVRRASTEKFDRIEHLRDRITLHQGDLLDHRSLVDTLRGAQAGGDLQPRRDVVRRASPGSSPTLTAEFTGVGVTRLLEASARGRAPRRASTRPRSSEMFGKVREVPQTELTPFYPRSPYGVAKVYGHFITVNYRESYDLHADLGDPLQPREPTPRARVRDPQDHLARRGDQARPGATSWRSATSTPSATGATPRTTSRRCG